jgi:acyl-CoA dehydrogenase
LTFSKFTFGQSNPTYQLIAADGQKYVMRKKPPGKLISKMSHRVEREYEILSALADTEIPVPKTYALCMDDTVIGTPFYIMEFLDGRVFEDQTLPGVTPEERDALYRDAIRTLAKFHCVDPMSVGLERFGRVGGFYNRQIQTWEAICSMQEKVVDVTTNEPVGRLPFFEECLQFFKDERSQPKDRVSLVHGDFRIDNLVFHKTEPRVIGVLEYVHLPCSSLRCMTANLNLFSWESSTIGHPLSDVCNFLIMFYTARYPGASPYDTSGLLPGRTPGIPLAEEIVQWYAATSWYNPMPDFNWGMAFNVFKIAGVCQGIAARVAAGQAGSKEALSYARASFPQAELAWNLVQLVDTWERARL